MFGREPFIRAIVEHPNDDVPRLVFADWLDEHGDGPRADFIRTQIELSRLVRRPPNRFNLYSEFPPTIIDAKNTSRVKRLQLRSKELLHKHNGEWVHDWAVGLSGLFFWRGFVERINTTAGMFVANIFGWLKHEPITAARIGSLAMMYSKLAECEGLLALRTLELDCNENEIDFAMEHLGQSHYCRNLEELILPTNRMPGYRAKVLLSSSHLTALKTIAPFTWDKDLLNGINWWARSAFQSRFGPQKA